MSIELDHAAPTGYRITVEGKAPRPGRGGGRGPNWDENLHPRDRLGRFIETGAEVRIWGGATGTVLRNIGNGRIEVLRSDGAHVVVHRNYLTVTKRPDGSAPTAQAGNAADMPQQAPEKPDAPELDIPSEPTPGADAARDRGNELTAAVQDPKLSAEVRDRVNAYHEAVSNNVPGDEADERAALRDTLDRVQANSGGDADVDKLANDVWLAAAAEPAAAAPNQPNQPNQPDVPEAPNAPAASAIGDQLTRSEGQTVNLHMTNGDAVTGQVVSSDGRNVDVQLADGTTNRVRVSDIDRVDRAVPTATEGNGTISNPDDPNGPPSYEGPLDQAHTQLAPGTYDATDDNGNPVTVDVTDDTSTVSPRTEGNEPTAPAAPVTEAPAASPPQTVEAARDLLRAFGARLAGARRNTVTARVGQNARNLARTSNRNLRLSPSGGVIARRSTAGAWVPYAVGNADRISDAAVQFTDDEIDDVLRRYDALGIPFGDHDAATARWRDRDQRRADADAIRAIGRDVTEARGGRPAVQGASRGRFRDIDAVRRHLRNSPNRSVSLAIALDPLAELSSSGRLLIHRDPDGERGYRVATTHAGKRLTGRLFGTRQEALTFADQIENNLLDKDGNPYPFDGAIGERRLRTWRNAQRQSVAQVVMEALRNLPATDPRPEEFNDAWYNQQYTPGVDLPDDLTAVSPEELTRLSNLATANNDRASATRIASELTRRRNEDRQARMTRPLSDAERRMFTLTQANGDQALAERNMRDLFDFTHTNGWKIQWNTVRISDRNSTISGDIVDTDGRMVGRVTRSVIQRRNGDVEIHHDLLAISGQFQGQGFADAFYKTLYDRYQERGIDLVTIDANIDVGGYAWAQRGFDWSGGSMPGMALTRALANIDGIDTSGMSDADKARIQQFREDVRDRKFTPKELANALSDMRWKKQLPSGKEIDMWPGKVAMLGTYWGGEFRVADLNRPDVTPRPDRPEAAPTPPQPPTPPPPPPPPPRPNVADMTDAEMLAEMHEIVRQGAMLSTSPLFARRQELLDEAARRRAAARPPVRVSDEAVGGMNNDALNTESTRLSNQINELMNEQGRDESDPDVARVIARQREIGTERHRRIAEARNDLIPDGDDVPWTDLKVGDTVVVPFVTERGPEVATISSIYGNELRLLYDDGTEQRYYMVGSLADARWRRANKPETVGGSETVTTRDLNVGDRLLLDDGRTARIDSIGDASNDRILLEVTDDTGQAREIEADRYGSHIRVTGDEPAEVTRPDVADMTDDDLTIEWTTNQDAGASATDHPLHNRQAAVRAELRRRGEQQDAEIRRALDDAAAARARPVDVEDVTEPTARPRLYTYQRKNLVALGLDTPAAGAPPLVQQAAARVRARQPLTAAQSEALRDHLDTMADDPALRVVKRRSTRRLAQAFDTSATVAAGRRAEAPQPGNDRVQRVRGTGLTAGDTAVLRDSTGRLVTARITSSQSMMRGTVARVTYTDPEGNEITRMLDRDSDVWLMPDLPPDRVDPPTPQPGDELAFGEDLRVGDTIAYLRGGRYYEGRISSIEQTGDQLHVHYEDGADNWMTPGEIRTRTGRGPESTDQNHLYVVQRLDTPESISGSDVQIGDRIVVDLYDPPAQGTVRNITDVVPANGTARGKRIDFIDDSGADMSVTVFEGMNVQRTARAADNATATIQAVAQERDRRARESDAGDALNRIQTSAVRVAASSAMDLTDGNDTPREAVLQLLQNTIADGGYASSRNVNALSSSLGTENQAAVMAIGNQIGTDAVQRLMDSVAQAEPLEGENEYLMVRRVLQQNLEQPPLRHNRQVARSLLASIADLAPREEQNAEVGNLPPRIADKDLSGRMDSYRRALGGQFGYVETRFASFGRLNVGDLERGVAPAVQYTDAFPRREKAEDGGPGERTMRQLEVMRAAGADLDASLQDRIQAHFQNLGIELPPEAQGQTISTYMAQLRTMAKRLRTARETAYNRMVAARSRDLEDARAEFSRANRELAPVDKLLNELQMPFADAQRQAAKELISEIRPVGGVRLQYQEADPQTRTASRGLGRVLAEDDSEVRSMRSAEDVLPADWLTSIRDSLSARYGRERMGIARVDRGHADFRGNIRLSGWGERFTGDPGSGWVAVHEMGHYAERHVPGLMAAEEAFLWSRTSTGAVGSRQRDTLENMRGRGGDASQFGFPDDFPLGYTGVDYMRHTGQGRVESYEVVSTGLESLFAGSNYLDDDFRQFLLGTLALL